MPACSFIMSKREQQPSSSVPRVIGTPSHLPSNLPRYSTAGSIGPFLATTLLTTSSTGSSARLNCAGSQLVNSMMSWPDLACASTASVSSSLLPWLVM